MKSYNWGILRRLLLVVLLACGMGFLLSYRIYWSSVLVLLLLIWGTIDLFWYLKWTSKNFQRLVEAIEFSEFNVSFHNSSIKGRFPELTTRMQAAIEQFNKKVQLLAGEQQFYNTLLNRIDAAILVIGPNGEIEWINKAALDVFGKPQPRRLSDLKSLAADLPGTLDKMLPQETKIIRFPSERGLRQLAATAVVFTSGGKEVKLISFKNIQSVLEESESDAWKKLIRVLTHEMVNSITPIISLSETLAEQAENVDNKVMMQAMETIYRRSKGLLQFIANYQKLTRIPMPQSSEFPAKEMLDDISRLLHADGIRFKITIQPEDILFVADRVQIEQVLINLIKNSWEACTEKSHADVRVGVTKNEYQRPVITISDNGAGILPEVLDKIFVPFFTTKTGGSGIGLSICRQILNLHGGTLKIDSVPEVGTKVMVRL